MSMPMLFIYALLILTSCFTVINVSAPVSEQAARCRGSSVFILIANEIPTAFWNPLPMSTLFSSNPSLSSYCTYASIFPSRKLVALAITDLFKDSNQRYCHFLLPTCQPRRNIVIPVCRIDERKSYVRVYIVQFTLYPSSIALRGLHGVSESPSPARLRVISLPSPSSRLPHGQLSGF